MLNTILRVDSNKSGSITPAELQSALVNGNNTKFNITTINMMISMLFKYTHLLWS